MSIPPVGNRVNACIYAIYDAAVYVSREAFNHQAATNIVNGDDQAQVKATSFTMTLILTGRRLWVVLRGDDESSEIYIPSAKRIS